MAKDTFWFSHDYNSRSDRKLLKLRMKHGMLGIGVYWCIVEMLYEENGYIQINDYERISFELQSNNEVVTSVINDFELFSKDEEKFWSNSVISRLELRKIKSNKARESISYRWNNTNVIQSKNDTNTIKDIKEKKRIVEEGQKWNFIKPSQKELKMELSENELNTTIEFIDRLKRVKLLNKQVLNFWEAFKLQNFNGEKTYNTKSDIVNHFRNWLKDLKSLTQISVEIKNEKQNHNPTIKPVSEEMLAKYK